MGAMLRRTGRYWHRKRLATLLALATGWAITAFAHRETALAEQLFQGLLAAAMLPMATWAFCRPYFPNRGLFELRWFSEDPADPRPAQLTNDFLCAWDILIGVALAVSIFAAALSKG